MHLRHLREFEELSIHVVGRRWKTWIEQLDNPLIYNHLRLTDEQMFQFLHEYGYSNVKQLVLQAFMHIADVHGVLIWHIREKIETLVLPVSEYHFSLTVPPTIHGCPCPKKHYTTYPSSHILSAALVDPITLLPIPLPKKRNKSRNRRKTVWPSHAMYKINSVGKDDFMKKYEYVAQFECARNQEFLWCFGANIRYFPHLLLDKYKKTLHELINEDLLVHLFIPDLVSIITREYLSDERRRLIHPYLMDPH